MILLLKSRGISLLLLCMLSKWLAVRIVSPTSMKSLMIPLKLFHHPSGLCEVVTKGSIKLMVLPCACDKKLPTNLVRLLTAHGYGYVAVNFLFQLIFVLNSLEYIKKQKTIEK